jgi:Lon protease-like protein
VDGTYEVHAVGRERFRLLDSRLHRDGFLIGVVEPFEEGAVAARSLTGLMTDVSLRLQAYLKEIVHLTGVEIGGFALPDGPADLSYLAAAVLQVPLAERQELLEAPRVSYRLKRERELLDREIERLRSGAIARRQVTARPLDRARILAETTRN